VTTVLLKASLGSEQYQSMNSRMAWSHERFELEDVRVFKTADRLRLLFAIGRASAAAAKSMIPSPIF
jgi:hypothetical protein